MQQSKCDLQRPTCFRCEKANTTCGGYERDAIFVNQTPTQPSLTAASVIARAKLENDTKCAQPIYEEDMRSLISEGTSSSYIPLEFRSNAVKMLEKIYLPKPLRMGHAIGLFHSWLYTLNTLTEESKALDLSILAFCIVQTRLTKTSTFSLEESLQFYSQALGHHRTDLQDEQKRARDESFATIVVLTTCEVFIYPLFYSMF
jgi:hypothetical protein